jgi:hypothetical protein
MKRMTRNQRCWELSSAVWQPHLFVAPMTSTWPLSLSPSMSASSTLTTLAKIWSLLLDLQQHENRLVKLVQQLGGKIALATKPCTGTA